MLEPDLRQKVDGLWDKFWAGGLANPLMAIDQMNYLIFLNRLEHMDDNEAKRARARNEAHSSVFDGEVKTPEGEQPASVCRFSFWQRLPAAAMFEHLQTVVFPWMKALAPDNHAFTSFMRDASFLIPKPSLLVEAVNVLAGIRITDRNIDVQGDIYEHMLGKLGVAGQIGQFRTPRHIIRAMVQMLDPQIGETVLDPACGTAGFLIAAYQHMIASGTSEDLLEYDENGTPHNLLGDNLTKKQWAWLRNGGLVGSDFDPSMVRIAAMNMVLHGIERPNVSYADSLGKQYDHSPRAKVVLANPPFAGSVATADVSEQFRVKTGKTELLFLELIEDLLLPGGRAAVIVPDGVLFGTLKAHVTVRQRLLDNNRLDGIISLPGGVFRPYAGVKASIVIFTAGGQSENVWMYAVSADGWTLDDKRLPSDANDLPDLLRSWPDRLAGPRSGIVAASEIRAHGYNLSPRTYDIGGSDDESRELPTVSVEDALTALAEARGELRDAEVALAEGLRAAGYE